MKKTKKHLLGKITFLMIYIFFHVLKIRTIIGFEKGRK